MTTRRRGPRLAAAAGLAALGLAAATRVAVAGPSDNAAYAWGPNSSGELGNGTTTPSDVPVKVDLPAGVRVVTGSVGAGWDVVVDDTGTVWSWGAARQLGAGDAAAAADSPVPVRVALPAGVAVTAVAAGDGETVALDGDGGMWEWGFFSPFPGMTENQSNIPVRVPVPAGERFSAIAAGAYGNAAAIDTAGDAWAWGDNTRGELGDGRAEDSSAVPVRVHMPAGVRFTAIGAGGAGGPTGMEDVIALDQDGQAWGWGDNGSGSAGIGTKGSTVDVPTRVVMPPGVPRFTSIAVGGGWTEALDPSGHVWGWGWNDGGWLGIADTASIGGAAGFGAGSTGTAVAADMPAGVSFTQVAAGSNYSIALDENGDAWAWGGGAGTLGVGPTPTFSLTPVRVTMPAGVRFSRLLGGGSGDTALALSGDLTLTAPAAPPAAAGEISASTIALSLVSPRVAFGSPQLVVAGTVLAVAATVFTTFPGNLVNLTLQENEEEIRRWLGGRLARPRAALSRLLPRRDRASPARTRGIVEFAAVVVVAALLSSLNDPTLAWNARAVATCLSVAGSLLLGIAVAAAATWAYHRARFGRVVMRFRAIPLGLLVAGACVVVSRLTSFQPGYLYGVVCGIAFARTLERDERGHVALAVATTTVAVAIAAWIGTDVLATRAHSADPSLGVVVADNVLAAFFVGGVVGTLVNLIPLALLPGGAIRAWRVDAWGIAFGASFLLLVNVLLFHGSLSGSAPLFTTLGLFLLFGGASVAVRDWSLRRRRRELGLPAPTLGRRLRDLATPADEVLGEASAAAGGGPAHLPGYSLGPVAPPAPGSQPESP